jgi:ketosteroid isomerase-like protein
VKTRRITPRRALAALVFAAASMVSDISLARDDARLAALKGAELERFAANVSADVAALEKHLDADLAYAHSNGELDTKASFIKSLTDGTRDYLSTEPTIDSVRIIGDVAIVRGTAKVSVANKGGPPVSFTLAYTDVWLWKDQRWQMTEWRSARLPPGAGPSAAR